jgi:hypothetical protein
MMNNKRILRQKFQPPLKALRSHLLYPLYVLRAQIWAYVSALPQVNPIVTTLYNSATYACTHTFVHKIIIEDNNMYATIKTNYITIAMNK